MSRTHRTRRRVLIGLASTAATMAMVPTAAQADSPTRTNAEYWGVDCVYDLGGGETLFLYGSGSTDGAEGGVGAFVEDAHGRFLAEGWTDQFMLGDTFATSLDLGGTEFAILADLDRGETQTLDVDERSGNGWTKGTMTQTDLVVETVDASYGGQAVDLTGGSCGGDITGFDVFSTDPAATIYRFDDFYSEICAVEGLSDGLFRVRGELPEAVVELVIDHGVGDVEKAQGEVLFRGGDAELATEVVDVFTGEVRTTADIDLSLERDGRAVRHVEGGSDVVERTSVTPYRIDVAVALGDGREGTGSCAGMAVTTHVMLAPHAEESH